MLLCVLANPALTAGTRSLGRIELARDVLGYEAAQVRNLFAYPSHRTGGIATLGAKPDGWINARQPLLAGLGQASGVLLGYGLHAPSGAAREHHRTQVDWLVEQIKERTLPVFQFGDGPRHPSRWQRWTHRHHADLGFTAAVRLGFAEVEF